MYGTYTLLDCIKCEIKDAQEYIDLTHEFKSLYPPKAKLFLEIATDELRQAEKLIEHKNKYFQNAKEEHEPGRELWNHMVPTFSLQIAELNREIDRINRELRAV